MAYNPYLYNPYLYQPFPQPTEGVQPIPQVNGQTKVNTPQTGLIWVQGEAGAKAYLVAPNQTVQLWDSEEKTIYLKSADASGMPSMKILDYTIRGEERTEKKLDLSGYITRDEFEKRLSELKAVNNHE